MQQSSQASGHCPRSSADLFAGSTTSSLPTGPTDRTAHLPDAHEVRSEEAATRRRGRCKIPERMKLKRAANAQRSEEHVSVEVVEEISESVPSYSFTPLF